MALAVTNTVICGFMSSVVWGTLSIFTERYLSVPHLLNGMMVGLVAITPACGYINVYGSPVIAVLAGVASYFSIPFFKKFLKVDDVLDVWSIHGVAG